MKQEIIQIDGRQVRLITVDTAVVGTGCAGYNGADWLHTLGREDTVILTEGVRMGTSRNTGSDKQTYYKLSLASGGADSVREMAETLYQGGSVHGDIALAEAACSVKCFMKLANLGVAFPVNPYGEYVGYKTDHDPRQRATSAGPLTSRDMTQVLEQAVRQKGIPVLDGMQAAKLLVKGQRLYGMICLDINDPNDPRPVLINCRHVILATGGPAGIYGASVYPESQTGATGLAAEAGAELGNLQEWQYGLASLKFRWNVSGTYQQVLPRYLAVDAQGNSREFLYDYFESPAEVLNRVFLKGYQWPFDVAKAQGSSLIDLIVHQETAVKGNRVYLDFRQDPAGLAGGFGGLCDEAVSYLEKSGALVETPIKRLAIMNPKAIQLYKEHGIDLYREPLEIGVCAQHNNGGIGVNCHWETTIRGLYAAGEAAGTFGVYRPGGSALNSTQVGSLRAAEHIACTTDPDVLGTEQFTEAVGELAGAFLKELDGYTDGRRTAQSPADQWEESRRAMSRTAGHIRSPQEIKKLYQDCRSKLSSFSREMGVSSRRELPLLLKWKDILTAQAAVLSAMEAGCELLGSRGSALVLEEGVESVSDFLPGYCLRPERIGGKARVLVTRRDGQDFQTLSVPVRPIPPEDDWFETVWADYRKRTERLKTDPQK